MNEKLDNLIPLRGRLNHWQLAGWEPPAPVEQGLGCRLLADVPIPMPDGVRLSADVYTPKKRGRYPGIVQFAAYNRDLHTTGIPKGTSEIGSPPIIADRGYVQVVVTARGVGRSEGELTAWHTLPEIEDYVRCVEWAAEQPWCNGDICLFGTSYYGMIQAAVAARRPPMLRAFFANEVCTAYRRHVFRYGGHFNADFVTLWVGANFTRAGIKRYIPPVARAALSQVMNREWPWKLMHSHIDRIMAGFKTREVAPEALRLYAGMLSEAGDSAADQWDGPSSELSRVKVPFVVVQNRGLIALHQFGAYDLFANASTPADRRWLIIGPAEYELPVYSWQLEALAFFDHVVKGAANGYNKLAHLRYWVDGAESWNGAEEFPPRDAKMLRLYLARTAEENVLVEAAPAGGSASWQSVPRGAVVLPKLDELLPQQLRFAGAAPGNCELIGPVTLNLRYACSEIDSYVVARLDRVDGVGERCLLSMGHLRPALRAIDPSQGSPAEIVVKGPLLPLQPGEPVQLRLSMTVPAARLNTGDRLELLIASRTDLFRPRVQDGFVAPDMPVPPYFARNSVFLGHDSSLELTMRPV